MTTAACLAGHPVPDLESSESNGGNVIVPDDNDGSTGRVKADPT